MYVLLSFFEKEKNEAIQAMVSASKTHTKLASFFSFFTHPWMVGEALSTLGHATLREKLRRLMAFADAHQWPDNKTISPSGLRMVREHP